MKHGPSRTSRPGQGTHHRLSMAGHGVSGSIARPATLVVDKSGIIRYIYIGWTQFDMVRQEEVRKRLNELTP